MTERQARKAVLDFEQKVYLPLEAWIATYEHRDDIVAEMALARLRESAFDFLKELKIGYRLLVAAKAARDR